MDQKPFLAAILQSHLHQLIDRAARFLVSRGNLLQFGLQKDRRNGSVDQGVNHGEAERQEIFQEKFQSRFPRRVEDGWQQLLEGHEAPLSGAGRSAKGFYKFYPSVHPSIHSALAQDNRVLELDGDGSYVELPPNIFDGLEEATVEGWMKWESLGNWSRFFDSGTNFQAITVTILRTTAQFDFELWPLAGINHTISAPGMVRPGEWCHIAAVSVSALVRPCATKPAGSEME